LFKGYHVEVTLCYQYLGLLFHDHPFIWTAQDRLDRAKKSLGAIAQMSMLHTRKPCSQPSTNAEPLDPFLLGLMNLHQFRTVRHVALLWRGRGGQSVPQKPFPPKATKAHCCCQSQYLTAHTRSSVEQEEVLVLKSYMVRWLALVLHAVLDG
jgi:hypothetical protein